MTKKPYPHDKDIVNAIMNLLAKKPWINPMDFPGEVRDELEKMGFFTGLVSVKRIWRIYEKMVRRGWVQDYLGVVSNETESIY